MFGGYKTFIEKMMNVLKEELIYLHGRIDKVEINQHESNTAMTTGLKMIANYQTDIAKALREQTASDKELADKHRKWAFAIANKDNPKAETKSDTAPLFDCCSKNLAEQRNWVNIVKGQIALAVDKTKIPEGSIYIHLYAGMKSHDGYDVDQLWRTYGKSKYATKLDMFAASDMLRLSFEKGVYRFYLSKGTYLKILTLRLLLNSIKSCQISICGSTLCPLPGRPFKTNLGWISIAGVYKPEAPVSVVTTDKPRAYTPT